MSLTLSVTCWHLYSQHITIIIWVSSDTHAQTNSIHYTTSSLDAGKYLHELQRRNSNISFRLYMWLFDIKKITIPTVNSDWVSERPHQHITGHFGDESFQSITWTGTDNLTRTTKRQNTQITQQKVALVNTQSTLKRHVCQEIWQSPFSTPGQEVERVNSFKFNPEPTMCPSAEASTGHQQLERI